MQITYDQLNKITNGRGKKHLKEGFVTYFNKHAATFGVNNFQRVSHFVSQCCHEADAMNVMEEYASGVAYEGRRDLGNTQPGDGKRYKGRGFIQITGRANYRYFGKIIGYDLENNPELAEDPEISVLTSLAYWQDRKLNSLADADNLNAITKRINGGYNGLKDRALYLQRAKAVFRDVDFSEQTEIDFEEEFTELKFGDRGIKVRKLQQKLIESGYELKVDGAFGPATQKAVKELQNDLDLTVTGIVDKDLWEILEVGVEDSDE